ncbi:TIGR03915 family putative DNA repair protein [Tenacibaculum tangerinum]|uniref:TIGR03915 family putative DNA repair protein n=1 Tax=Tenacibaculum tangerinum TaxID=3038772 RepID=UPI002ADDB5FF|nr:TIGR03915 family putative DNA repair protein [Tenacibaculum tangerinum]
MYSSSIFFKKNIEKDYSNDTVLKIAKLRKSVGREKHRMEAFVRFKLTKDNIYFANIEPDFNVLPLIAKHFKSRYADQKWLIYDIKRKYGLFYNLDSVEIIELEFDKSFDFSKTSDKIFTVEELEFQQLWKDYFKSTNIASRKNTKLHTQHVPKRYWKYLSEKQ